MEGKNGLVGFSFAQARLHPLPIYELCPPPLSSHELQLLFLSSREPYLVSLACCEQCVGEMKRRGELHVIVMCISIISFFPHILSFSSYFSFFLTKHSLSGATSCESNFIKAGSIMHEESKSGALDEFKTNLCCSC